jgi:hypothetical protein
VLCDSTCHNDNNPPTDSCVVTDQFGIFVAPGAGASTPTGTMAAPYGTIQAGINAAKGHVGRVYVCAGTDTTPVALTSASAAVTVYGGFNCSTWAYSTATEHVIVAPASGVALTMTGVTAAITIENIEFDAVNASGNDTLGNGTSSMAAFAVSTSSVTLSNVTLKAGNAVNAGNAVEGNDGGVPPSTNYSGGATAPSGEDPALGDAGATTGGTIACTDGTSSKGGLGGEASTAVPNGVSSGGPGISTPTATGSAGVDGAGGGAGTSGIDGCGNGHSGANGAPLPAVAGAANWGTLIATGWTPALGSNGVDGDTGQGGGGGGGSTAPALAGGSGGSGGCGGAGGLAGAGGGSSFALLAFDSPISLVACTLESGNAGSGAAGSKGQDGQGGGAPGTSAGGCGGGFGGNGAGGGGGGGGAAGVSLGVGYVGTSPTLDVTTNFNGGGMVSGQSGGGNPGTGGTNALGTGTSGNAGGPGIAGEAMKLQSLAH